MMHWQNQKLVYGDHAVLCKFSEVVKAKAGKEALKSSSDKLEQQKAAYEKGLGKDLAKIDFMIRCIVWLGCVSFEAAIGKECHGGSVSKAILCRQKLHDYVWGMLRLTALQ